MRVCRTVVVDRPLERVFAYLTDFTHVALFTFSGPLKYAAWLLRPAFSRLGDQAEAGLRSALEAL
ncbi:MAG TPA: hypothetical protein VFL99_12755 [Segeticoccus sp.]|uniref:hypothetical protein n=1 Tax=Segeticoccus sp. TaxID=2706531 RepID=UPI002D806516|nr:hypothetical protein [Segeticoccus sp.]HET8601192.1 hypothetical protein [Segeticoccus sp.]